MNIDTDTRINLVEHTFDTMNSFFDLNNIKYGLCVYEYKYTYVIWICCFSKHTVGSVHIRLVLTFVANTASSHFACKYTVGSVRPLCTWTQCCHCMGWMDLLEPSWLWALLGQYCLCNGPDHTNISTKINGRNVGEWDVGTWNRKGWNSHLMRVIL